MDHMSLKKDDVVMVTRCFSRLTERFFARVTDIELQNESACFFCYEPIDPPHDQYGRTPSMEGPFGNVCWMGDPTVTCGYIVEVEIVGAYEPKSASVMGVRMPVRPSDFVSKVRQSA